MHVHVGVDPEQRGRGLGTRLLAWAEPAALPLHRARYPGRPLALSARCPVGQDDALALLADAGYQQARWFHFMSRDLVGVVPDHQLPDGIRIAGYTDDRHRECYIASVGVTEAARGRGIASALLRRALAAAQPAGCDVATLYVDADSPTGALSLRAHRLHQAADLSHSHQGTDGALASG